eukprot:282830-Chlamydomonas_euryale.AAC.1
MGLYLLRHPWSPQCKALPIHAGVQGPSRSRRSARPFPFATWRQHLRHLSMQHEAWHREHALVRPRTCRSPVTSPAHPCPLPFLPVPSSFHTPAVCPQPHPPIPFPFPPCFHSTHPAPPSGQDQ